MVGRCSKVIACVAAASAAVSLAACTDDSESAGGTGGNQQTLPPSQPSTTDDATTSTTIDEQEAAEEALDAELRAAYDRYWETTAALYVAPDPNDPRLAEVATGLSLTVNRDVLGTYQVDGVRRAPPGPLATREVMSVDWEGRDDPDHDPSTVTEATVESCRTEDFELYDAAGARIDDNVATARWVQTLVLEDGAWRVSESEFFDVQQGVQPCVAV